MDDFILDHTRDRTPALDALRGLPRAATRLGAALHRVLWRPRRRAAAAARRARARICRPAASATAHRALTDAAHRRRIWKLREAALGLSMADEGRRQGDLVRRGHRRRPRAAARLHRAVPRRSSSATARRAGVYAHASVGCLHVRPVVNLKTEDGVATVRGDRRRGRRPGAGVRRRAVRRARRRPGAQPVQREDVRPGAVPGVPEGQAHVRSRTGLLNPGKIVDAPPLTSQPALRRRLRDAATRRPLRLLRPRRLRPRGRDVQRRRRLPQDARGDDVPVATWRRATRRTRRAAGPTPCAWRSTGGSARPAWRCGACTRCSTCAWSARPARASARSTWTWPLQERVPRRLLGRARHAAAKRGRSAMWTRSRGWGSRLRADRRTASRPARWVGVSPKRRLGIDRRRTPPPGRDARCDAGWHRASDLGPTGAPVLFADTFTEHVEPEIGVAAFEVLEAAGIATDARSARLLRPPADLARVAAGSARDRAARNVNALYPCAAAGRRRSSSSSRAACRRCARMRRICCADRSARRRAWSRQRACCSRSTSRQRSPPAARPLDLAPGPREILLHGHCHQRSMGLAASAAALLRRIPGATVIDLDAGCCGMAGSFGYPRSLRRVARHRRAEAPAGRTPPWRGRGARGRGHVVPSPGATLHRRAGLTSRRSHSSLRWKRRPHESCLDFARSPWPSRSRSACSRR